MKIYEKCRREFVRMIGIAQSTAVTFRRINQIIVGWINYYRIGITKTVIDEFGQWLLYKIRVTILKQWKKPEKIYVNLQKLNKKFSYHFINEQIFSVTNSRRAGPYSQACSHVVNFITNPKFLSKRIGERPRMVNPLNYYLSYPEIIM